jgi:hypothetical protein
VRNTSRAGSISKTSLDGSCNAKSVIFINFINALSFCNGKTNPPPQERPFPLQENFDADLAPALGPQADLDEIDAFTVQEESTQHRDPK